jgi:hypothetical protein
MKTTNIKPTPQGMADALIAIIQGDGTIENKKFARNEIIKALEIAYAFWYPDEKKYQIEGYRIVKE